MYHKTEQEVMGKWKGDSTNPLVSILCTTYNHEKYIEDTIKGFLMQESDFSFEIIIHDDASTDGTADIIREYEAKYPKLIKPIYQTKNRFSQGLKNGEVIYPRAKGKYIALCEGDDYWTDSLKLQMQVDFLEENDEYVVTYASVEAFDENGIIKGYVGGVIRDLESVELQKASPINTLTACFRNVVKELPSEFQCTKFGDLFLWSLLGQYGKGKYLSDIKPSKYRITSTGAFSGQTKQRRKEMSLFTNSALYSYYYRIGNKELAYHFQERSLRAAISAFGLYSFIKMVLKKFLQPVLKKDNFLCRLLIEKK